MQQVNNDDVLPEAGILSIWFANRMKNAVTHNIFEKSRHAVEACHDEYEILVLPQLGTV